METRRNIYEGGTWVKDRCQDEEMTRLCPEQVGINQTIDLNRGCQKVERRYLSNAQKKEYMMDQRFKVRQIINEAIRDGAMFWDKKNHHYAIGKNVIPLKRGSLVRNEKSMNRKNSVASDIVLKIEEVANDMEIDYSNTMRGHEGEDAIRRELYVIGKRYLTMSNVNLRLPDGDSVEIDSMIFTPTCIFTIEAKNVGYSGEELYIDEAGRFEITNQKGAKRTVKNPSAQALGHSLMVEEVITSRGYKNLEVKSVVVIANDDVKIKKDPAYDESVCPIIGVQELVSHIIKNVSSHTYDEKDFSKWKHLIEENLAEEKRYPVRQYDKEILYLMGLLYFTEYECETVVVTSKKSEVARAKRGNGLSPSHPLNNPAYGKPCKGSVPKYQSTVGHCAPSRSPGRYYYTTPQEQSVVPKDYSYMTVPFYKKRDSMGSIERGLEENSLLNSSKEMGILDCVESGVGILDLIGSLIVSM